MTYEQILEAIKDIPSNVRDEDSLMHVKYLQDLPEHPYLLDFGTGWGKLVVSMALACPQAHIETFDTGKPYGPEWPEELTKILESHVNLIPRNGSFINYCDNSYDNLWNKPLDVLSIDSSHTYEDTKHEVEKYYPFVKPGGLIFMHDYNVESVGVKQAVDEYLVDHPEYKIIDEAGYTTVLKKD